MKDEEITSTVGEELASQDLEEVKEIKTETTDTPENADQADSEEAEAKKETESAQSEDEEAKEAKKERKRVQRRIDRLTKEKYEKEAENEALRAQLRQPDQLRPQGEDEELDLAAVIDQAVTEREQQKAADAFTKKSVGLLEEAATLGDFDLDDFIPLPRGAADAVVELGSAELVVHLQENPDLIDSLEDLSPAMQAVEIGKLEAKLKAPKPVKKSKAPKPIEKVGGGKSPSTGLSDDMSTEDWIKERNKQARG